MAVWDAAVFDDLGECGWGALEMAAVNYVSDFVRSDVEVYDVVGWGSSMVG